MAHRILIPETAFSKVRQRRPRAENKNHLAFIRSLTCVCCGSPNPDPAHIRTESLLYGKPFTGGGTKPDDKWSVPLCRSSHDRQHSMNEMAFWQSLGIDPFALALALYAASGDHYTAEIILHSHRERSSVKIGFDGIPMRRRAG